MYGRTPSPGHCDPVRGRYESLRPGGPIHLDKLSAITIFVRVVEAQGFTAAARTLDLSTSYVSRQISALENRLGVRLLNRSTRRQNLTPVGALFYRNCASIIAQLEEAELAVTQMTTVPRGLLRVHAPNTFGAKYVAPVVAQFMSTYDGIEVEVELEDRRVDPTEEGFDIVVRLGETAGGKHLSKCVAPMRRMLVAAPEYVAQHGTPTIPSELDQHACLVSSADGEGSAWQLHSEAQLETVHVRPTLTANRDDVLRTAALLGRGIAYLSDYLVASDIQQQTLIQVLPDWVEDTVGVHAVYPENKHLSARVRLFIDSLELHLRRHGPSHEE